MTEPVDPLKGKVIASYLVKVTIRTDDEEATPPSLAELEALVESQIEATFVDLAVRASAERTDI